MCCPKGCINGGGQITSRIILDRPKIVEKLKDYIYETNNIEKPLITAMNLLYS